VGIWDFVDIDCQKWFVVQMNGYYSFVNKNSNKYLDVENGQIKNYTRVHQWGGNGNWAEQFRLVAVTTSSTLSNKGADWALAQIGKSIDYDGVSGVQCVDLIKAYYAYLGVSPVKGNGCDYINNALPTGWQRIKNTSDFIPQPGDIAIWTSSVGGGYGHVAIVVSGELHEFASVDQNWKCKSAQKITHSYSGFWGVIRPKF
jgi:surface antigen